ncbi:hypothetical protein [Mangrovibacterium sp.]|uniref:hypothetical protein n=1 Tax=Mangrovibacterium sp. TaxID=1961364 RepID=UPI00356A8052
MEGADNADVDQQAVTPKTAFENSFEADFLGGVEVISASDGRGIAFRAIPYYVWDNCGANKMKVWLPGE